MESARPGAVCASPGGLRDAVEGDTALASTYQGMGGGRAGVVEPGVAMWRGWMGCVGWTQRGEGVQGAHLLKRPSGG